MRLVSLFVAIMLIATAAFAGELTWRDLAAKPELLPSQCTIKQGFQFQSGLSVKYKNFKENHLESRNEFNPTCPRY